MRDRVYRWVDRNPISALITGATIVATVGLAIPSVPVIIAWIR